MRLLIQRVSRAQANQTELPNSCIASIEKGMVVLVGIGPGDSRSTVDAMLRKLKALRCFADAERKMNLAAADVSASYLFVSQFTLFADCRKGTRPSFTGAAPRPLAEELYDYLGRQAPQILQTTRIRATPFGSDLAVELVNDGPVTLWLDSLELF